MPPQKPISTNSSKRSWYSRLMAANKSSSKLRRLGVLKNLTPVSSRDGIPKLSSLNSKTHVPPIESDLNGVLGNSMAVPPQKDRTTAREERPGTKSDAVKSDSASSSKSQEMKDKEVQELKVRHANSSVHYFTVLCAC